MIRRDTDILRLDLRTPGGEQGAPMSLADVEAVRLILRGGSPIDWHRLNYRSLDDVDDLLRANLIDPDDPRDMARLGYLHREAVRYLRRNFAFRFPVEVEHPADVRHLFLYASETGRFNRVQILSCVVLKTLHTINHLEARELLHQTALSESELAAVVERQVTDRIQQLARDLPIVRFYGSRKGRDSMISKLLSKKATRAADILDRLRVRIIVEGRDDIVPTMAALLRYAFPWNHVAAGESSNNLVPFLRYLEEQPPLHPYLPMLQVDIGIEEEERLELENRFSGSSYRMINFVLDVPVRLDHLLDHAGDPWVLQAGSVVYVACEFQIIDQETAWVNEQGDNAHAAYKQRQALKVSERLMWGLLRERRARSPQRQARLLRLAQRPKAISALEATSSALRLPRPQRAPRPPQPALPEPSVMDRPAPTEPLDA